MKLKKILVACGAALATSVVVARKLEEELSRRNISIIIDTCKTDEVASRVKDYTILITTAPFDDKTINIPVIHPVSFLTGIGIERDMNKIVEIIEKNNIQ